MKDAALKQRNVRVNDWLANNAVVPLSDDLRQIADAFLQLQAERHRADYDLRPSARFTRREATDLVALAENALAAWTARLPRRGAAFRARLPRRGAALMRDGQRRGAARAPASYLGACLC